nr:MAG TPA: hypothetical protein [Caudoviricetes sp.]
MHTMKALELIASALLAVFLLGLGMVTAPYWGLVILLAACGITGGGLMWLVGRRGRHERG